MQEIHHFLQALLGFVLSCNVGEPSLDVVLGVDLGPALAQRHEIAQAPAGSASACDFTHHEHVDKIENEGWEYPPQDEIQDRGVLLLYLFHEFYFAVRIGASCCHEPVHQFWVIDLACEIGRVIGLRAFVVKDLAVFYHYFSYQAVVHVLYELAVVGLNDFATLYGGEEKTVQEEEEQDCPENRPEPVA